MPSTRRRNSLRYAGFDYSTPGAYFITFCTHLRRETLGKIENGTFIPSAAGEIITRDIEMLPSRRPHLQVDCFAVMPNHVHLLLLIEAIHDPNLTNFRKAPDSPDVREVIRGLKSFASRSINLLEGVEGRAVWQDGFYDHIVRPGNDQSLNRIREYILNNPLSWHLDRENEQRAGMNDFYGWIESFGKQPA